MICVSAKMMSVGGCRRAAVRQVLGPRADVVDPFEHDQPLHAGLREHVAIEAREGVRSKAAAEEAIAAETVIEDGHIPRRLVRLQAPGQHVGPAVVAVGRRPAPVGDGVAEHRNRRRLGSRHHVDAAQEVPMLHAHGRRQRPGRDGLTRLKERRRSGARMAGDVRRRAPHMNGNRRHRPAAPARSRACRRRPSRRSES